MTLLQSIQTLIDNINVTDRQEENISNSYNNLKTHLIDGENLSIEKVFLNGSYERHTIIRPLDDIDLFAVLNFDDYKDVQGHLPNPQSVLTKIKNYLNSLHDYEDKVTQDRPCVTVRLSDKNFDVLPCFYAGEQGYYMPNHDLQSWIITDPEGHSTKLTQVNQLRNNKVVPTVKIIKYWNRELDKLIPSYHIEEIAIRLFNTYAFTNFEESVTLWFTHSKSYIEKNKFDSQDKYEKAINNIDKAKEKIIEAHRLFTVENEPSQATLIWKDIFGREFPTLDVNEAKSFGNNLAEGTLKVSTTGLLSSSVGKSIPKSNGFFSE